MGFFADLFGTPKPMPVVIIRNVLGEEIDCISARDLYNQDLRGKQIGEEYLWEGTGWGESKNGEIRGGKGQNDQSTSVHTEFWLFRHLTPPHGKISLLACQAWILPFS